MIANRETLMFRAPFIELNPVKGAFTVSHVPYEELEVIAPTLEYTIYQASPVALRVKYKPTGKHLVQLNMTGAGGGGREIARFTVSNADIEPALLEGCLGYCLTEEEALEKRAADMLAKLKLKPSDTELHTQADALVADLEKAIVDNVMDASKADQLISKLYDASPRVSSPCRQCSSTS
eukprot:153364_1